MIPSQKVLRKLVVMEVLCYALAFAFPWIDPQPAYSGMLAYETNSDSFEALQTASITLFVPWVVLYLAASAALFFFNRCGRNLYVISKCMGTAYALWMYPYQPMSTSRIEGFLSIASILLSGAILALVFSAPLNAFFDKADALVKPPEPNTHF